jgi:hypothetical protein
MELVSLILLKDLDRALLNTTETLSSIVLKTCIEPLSSFLIKAGAFTASSAASPANLSRLLDAGGLSSFSGVCPDVTAATVQPMLETTSRLLTAQLPPVLTLYRLYLAGINDQHDFAAALKVQAREGLAHLLPSGSTGCHSSGGTQARKAPGLCRLWGRAAFAWDIAHARG